MHFLRQLFVKAARDLAEDPEARAKARQTFEHDVKPRAKEAWDKAQPEIEKAKKGFARFLGEVRDEYRKGRSGD
jgi:hypothetical protein